MWAAKHSNVLQQLLDAPLALHDLSGIIPRDGMRVGHIVALSEMLNKRTGGPWKRLFEQRAKGGQHVAFHVWLYHMCGGDGAKLIRPLLVHYQSKDIVQSVLKQCESFRYKLSTAKNSLQRGAVSETAHMLFDFNLLREKDSVRGRTARTASAGGGGSSDPLSTEEERLAVQDLRLLMARGVSCPRSPLHSLLGFSDILLNICDLAVRGGMCIWLPTPRAQPLLETRRHLYVEHAKVVALSEQLSARDTLITELQQEAERARRRELSACKIAEDARAAVQRVRDDEAL